MTNPFIEIHHLSKVFDPLKPPALQDINATIPQGKMVGLAGHDGSGKTTLIRLMAGLLLPTQGTIQVAGYDSIKDAQAIHYLTGYMPQKFGLYDDLTIMQNLVLYADLRGVVGEDRQAAFEKLLSFTGLAPFTKRSTGALSGGMKQKLSLACALIHKPSLLLLDEPSVGVDPISRRELWKMMQDLLKEQITIVWSTAYLDEAEKCDVVLLLNQGKLVYHGPPENLTQRVEGRTFKMTHIEGNRRRVLTQVLRQPNVMDGVIQGNDLRILTKKKADNSLYSLVFEDNPKIEIHSITPRFEDAFVDILGGGPGGWSELAEKTPLIKDSKEVAVEAKDLVKKFGNFTAADHINFSIRSGEIFGLLGPNGAGKSTIFKMMCGLLKPTTGSTFLNGLDLQKYSQQVHEQIGYMAQKFSLYGNLSVHQNLVFFSGIYNLKESFQLEMIHEMIEIFGFKPYLTESVDNLPLGFKQRLALACAVMHHPQILFLDEPTSGVDPIMRREFWNHINGLVEKGVTVMVTTHFIDEAEYCDRIGLIYRSKLITIGTPDELKRKAITLKNPTPTLEDAFIALIQNYEEKQNAGSTSNSTR